MTFGEQQREHYGRYPYALKDEEVAEIRSVWFENSKLLRGNPLKLSYLDMMARYGIAKNTFYRIINNDTYQWVQMKLVDGKLVWDK